MLNRARRQADFRFAQRPLENDELSRASANRLRRVPMALTIAKRICPQRGWEPSRRDPMRYDTDLVRKLYDQFWLNRLDNRGSITFSAQSGPPKAPSEWNGSAQAHGFTVGGTAFQVPELTVEGNAHTLVVNVHLAAAPGGLGEVVWEKSSVSPDASLTVDVASVTVRQILEIFRPSVQFRTARGCDESTWLRTVLHRQAFHGGRCCIQMASWRSRDSDIDVAGMHVDLAGTFDLSTSSTALAHIQGDVLHVPIETRC